ncbi:hypothetical protein [Aquihabitans sp. McL0605]|uniref:sunset domain-containing protein n=1 Tax=Aquihabitans sp. McL0605 TaxID=3415671 RepID=UPI003CF0D56E
MRGGKVRKLAVVALVVGAGAALFKSLRGRPAPQFSNHPTVTGGPSAAGAGTTEITTLVVTEPVEPEAEAVQPEAEAVQPEAAAEPEPAAEPTEPAPAAAASSGEVAWVLPIDGECPDSHPIKAKVKSGIYHLPGTPTYPRTKPDRCYPTAEAAEADGLRAPRRKADGTA